MPNIFVFVNNAHNPKLAYSELERCGISEHDSIEIAVDGDVRKGLIKLYNLMSAGDVVFVGTIGDFYNDNNLASISAVLYRLDSAEVVLRSHLERGCSYAELNARIDTAYVLQEVEQGGNLIDYR